MALTAHLDSGPAKAGKPRASRKRLLLEAEGASAEGPLLTVLIHNISATGLLLESSAPLQLNERVDVDLPSTGKTSATVIWTSGELYGCQFASPISSATLSAAELKGAARSGYESSPSIETPNETFGARLQRLRHAKGLTLNQVADQLGVSKPTVWAWEHGRAKPASKRIDSLAETLGITSEDLLHGRSASALADFIAWAKDQVASAYGTSSDKVRIILDL